MCFEPLGFTASVILANIAEKRVGARDPALVTFQNGEIERAAWLRKTDQPRRVDRSLLTENRKLYWGVYAQGDDRVRQARLLQRAKRHARARE